MRIDPWNRLGDLSIAAKGSNQQQPDGLAWGRRWLEIIARRGGMTNIWMGRIGADSSIEWTASLRPGTVPAQFSRDVIRELSFGGQPFTFIDRAELFSGGLFSIMKDGAVLGLLGVLSDQTDFFDLRTVRWMQTVSGLIADSLLYTKGEDNWREVEYSIAHALQASVDVYEVFPAVLDKLVKALGADAATALEYNPLNGRFRLITTNGLDSRILAKLNFHMEVGVPGGLAGNHMVCIQDLGKMDPSTRPINPLQEDGFRGYLALPLVRDGNLLGALEILWRSPRHATLWDAVFFERVTGQIAHALNRTHVLNRYRQITAELASRYDAMIEGLSRALELRDLETEGHTRRVSRLTLRLAEHVGIPADKWDAIRQGALLHDIGKIGIPDAILLKPGSLTDRERTVMQQHVVHGYNILAPIIDSRPVLDITLYHHERWDGGGYPYGLKGEQIPRVARLFAIVDVFDALTSDRPYRLAWSRTQALEFIREKVGCWFDPKIVPPFLEVVDGEF